MAAPAPAIYSLSRRAAAEGVGTALLVCAVVGSGIMGERLFPGNAGLALLANTVATGAVLLAVILAFGPVSGAHLNPAVTLADASQRGLPWRDTPAYLAAQFAGAFAGVMTAHLMFGVSLVSAFQQPRSGPAIAFSEFVATFGLLAVIWGCVRIRTEAVPFAVASYIVAAYWFTSSTSFANPAVTFGRAFTGSFSGIRSVDVPVFIVCQLLGAAAATVLFRWLIPGLPQVADRVVVPHTKPASTEAAPS